MKKFFLPLCLSFLALLSACASHDQEAVQALTDMFNSPEFAQQIQESGVIDSVHASVEDKTLIVTFNLIPGLDLQDMGPQFSHMASDAMLPTLREAADNDPETRRGFEALASLGLSLEMVFTQAPDSPSSQPNTVLRLTIDPAQILQ